MRKPLTTPTLGILLTATAFGTLPVYAQEAAPLRWTLEEFRTRCIPLWSDDPTAEAEDCTVAEFGEIAELDGSTFYFARYHDRPLPVPEGVEMLRLGEFNALVILRADPTNREEATVLHVRKREQYAFYQPLHFHAPELIQTDRGQVLYLRGSGLGDGAFQYQYDQYWLWRSGTWVPLDVHGWNDTMRERMPDGFGLGGIHGDIPRALRTLTYDAPVRRDGDYDCCPTGGTIKIQFEWDDLTLRVVSFEHDPALHLTD